MKYIRTKDGRVFYARKKKAKDVKLANDNLHWEAIPKGCDDYFTLNYEDNEIVKIADTIEELCDGFIFKDTHANELHFLDKNSGISLLGASLFEETLRGFIETDKGLIYVAKLNEEGNWNCYENN